MNSQIKPMRAPLLMQDDDPSDEQLTALMHEAGNAVRQRKAAVDQALEQNLKAQTQAALSRLKARLGKQ